MRAPFEPTGQLQVIGLAGGAGVGKDTLAANYFLSRGFLPVAFADEIKIRVVASGKATFEDVYITKPPYIRSLLQQEGTERGRDVYGEDYWANVLEAKMRVNAARWGGRFAQYVVTDVRFPNEVAWVKRLGGKVYRVEAPERYAKNGLSDEARNHRSERALDGFTDYDDVILNDPQHEATVGRHIAHVLLKDFGFAGSTGPGAFRIGVAPAQDPYA